MLRRVVGGLAGLSVVLGSLQGLTAGLAGASGPVPGNAPPAGTPPQVYPDKPAMLEYAVAPGAEACPSEEDFRVEVAILRGGRRDQDFRPVDVYDEESALVRVTLERLTTGKFRGTIEHVPAPGKPARPPEVMVNSECEDLVRDLAFPATLMLPLLAPPAPPAPATSPPCAPSGSEAPPSLPPPPAPAPPTANELPSVEPVCDPRRRGDPVNDRACLALLSALQSVYGPPVDPTVWLLGGGLMTLFYTSDPGAGLVLGVDVRSRRWSVAAEVQATLPAPVRAGPGLDADVSTFVGLIVPCVRFGETVRFVGCGVVGAGAYLSYDSQNATRWTDSYTIRIGPRAGVEVPLDNRFAFFASGEVSFSPTPIRLRYGDAGAWDTPVVSLFLSAGVSVRLGN